jgi:hypothetical protein
MSESIIEKLFADMDIPDSTFAHVWEARKDLKSYQKLLSGNPNLVVLTETINWANKTNNDGDTRRSKAWMNLLKVLTIEFMNDPYWNSRIGWLMWFWVCYARYDSYYPMGWCFHYDPLNHYRTGEPMRPVGLECTHPEDPFNIKGECFVHPEWYTKEYKDAAAGASHDTV